MKNGGILEKPESNSPIFSRAYTHNKLNNVTRKEVPVQLITVQHCLLWAKNILTHIISRIRGSTGTSYTGPPNKTLAAGLNNPWTRMNSSDLFSEHYLLTICYLLNEAWNYRRRASLITLIRIYTFEGRVYIHPRKLNFLFISTTLSTTFQYNFWVTALNCGCTNWDTWDLLRISKWKPAELVSVQLLE